MYLWGVGRYDLSSVGFQNMTHSFHHNWSCKLEQLGVGLYSHQYLLNLLNLIDHSVVAWGPDPNQVHLFLVSNLFFLKISSTC